MACVLVVDDSPSEVDKLRTILKGGGYDVIEANGGAEGVALAKQKMPDLVLMDIVMPGVNGFQAVKERCRNGRYSRYYCDFEEARDRPNLG